MSAGTTEENLRADPASAWVSRTARQQAKAAARFDREARVVLAATKKEAAQKHREAAIRCYRQRIEVISVLLGRGTKRDGTPLTALQISGGREMLSEAWSYLLRAGVVEGLS